MDLSDFTCSVCDEPSYGVGWLEYEHCTMYRESLCGRCFRWAAEILGARVVEKIVHVNED